MDNKKTKGTIFDTISWESTKQLNNLIDNMDEEQVRFLIIRALESSFTRGAYSLVESEIVSKLIRRVSYQDTSEDSSLKS